MGAATVSKAYEGFQLLTYDYDGIHNSRKTIPSAMFTSILAVIAVYVLVAFGATMLVGAERRLLAG